MHKYSYTCKECDFTSYYEKPPKFKTEQGYYKSPVSTDYNYEFKTFSFKCPVCKFPNSFMVDLKTEAEAEEKGIE